MLVALILLAAPLAVTPDALARPDGLRLADEWAGGRPQDDDITFVVVKIRH